MELSDTTRSILICCRWYGLAPYTIKRNKRNEIIDVKLSLWSCVFSFALMIFFIISVEYASLTDPNEGYSLRSKSTLSKYIYWLDMNLLLAAFVIHTITTVVSVRNTCHVNNLLNKVDTHFSLLNCNTELHSLRTRRRLALSVFIALFSLILFMSVDYIIWHQAIFEMRLKKHSDGNFFQDFNEDRYYLIPFFILYTSFVPLYAKCTTTIYRIGIRYRNLNNIILAASNRLSCFTLDNKGLTDITARLFKIHEALGEILKLVTSEFGLTLLCLMISSSFQITICVYSIVLESLGKNDAAFLISQVFWLLSHVVRIFVIVEPCHLVAFEGKRTFSCLSRLIRLNRFDPILKHFWQKLMTDRVVFSVCGLFQVDRTLLTSISAAISTYLVILFQFQK